MTVPIYNITDGPLTADDCQGILELINRADIKAIEAEGVVRLKFKIQALAESLRKVNLEKANLENDKIPGERV